LHQAADVHGLRAAAHGAVVVYELQSSEPRSVEENAAAQLTLKKQKNAQQ
jgi:hypothetical protein